MLGDAYQREIFAVQPLQILDDVLPEYYTTVEVRPEAVFAENRAGFTRPDGCRRADRYPQVSRKHPIAARRVRMAG